jgi:indolepyruvate ferredoxin oxidoreductase beta subunit
MLAHDPLNVIVCGVGGQGNIMASDLISRAFCEEGYHVSVGETYGATQRGGSVVSHIRLSRKHLYGPLIPLGEGHVIIGFEPLEVYRILRDYAHETVRVVMNNRPFYPLDSLRKSLPYPDMDRMLSRIEQNVDAFRTVQATELAKQAGNAQAQNVVMVGVFAGLNWVPLGKDTFLQSIRELFSDQKLQINLRAFELGFQAASLRNQAAS